MIGYVCRSKGTDAVFIAVGREMPSIDTTGKRPGWFWHAPGWLVYFAEHQNIQAKIWLHSRAWDSQEDQDQYRGSDMKAGYILFTKELCGETVVIKEKFGDLIYDNDSIYRNDLADFLLHVTIECGEIRLFHGVYGPTVQGKFIGDTIVINVDTLIGAGHED